VGTAVRSPERKIANLAVYTSPQSRVLVREVVLFFAVDEEQTDREGIVVMRAGGYVVDIGGVGNDAVR
jgi:hypothetical protein